MRDPLLTSTLRPHLDLCLPRTALPQKSCTPAPHSDRSQSQSRTPAFLSALSSLCFPPPWPRPPSSIPAAALSLTPLAFRPYRPSPARSRRLQTPLDAPQIPTHGLARTLPLASHRKREALDNIPCSSRHLCLLSSTPPPPGQSDPPPSQAVLPSPSGPGPPVAPFSLALSGLPAPSHQQLALLQPLPPSQ